MKSILADQRPCSAIIFTVIHTIQAATDLIQKASTGKGALATLMSNPEVANDLKALISNLRAHGVLFYRDSAAKVEAQRPPNQPRKTTRP